MKNSVLLLPPSDVRVIDGQPLPRPCAKPERPEEFMSVAIAKDFLGVKKYRRTISNQLYPSQAGIALTGLLIGSFVNQMTYRFFASPVTSLNQRGRTLLDANTKQRLEALIEEEKLVEIRRLVLNEAIQIIGPNQSFVMELSLIDIGSIPFPQLQDFLRRVEKIRADVDSKYQKACNELFKEIS